MRLSGSLTLENLTLNGGDVGNDTGGTVTLNNVTFTNNHANTGGAIDNESGCAEADGVPIQGANQEYPSTFSRESISQYFNSDWTLIPSTVDFNTVAIMSIFVQDRLDENGQVLQVGDYMWIWPEDETGHGLMVICWAETLDCQTAIDASFGYENSDYTLYRTLDEAINSQEVNVVPYVVDFNNGIQSQKPRPFYCTAYLESPYIYMNAAGEFEGGVFSYHNWWFAACPANIG